MVFLCWLPDDNPYASPQSVEPVRKCKRSRLNRLGGLLRFMFWSSAVVNQIRLIYEAGENIPMVIVHFLLYLVSGICLCESWRDVNKAIKGE